MVKFDAGKTVSRCAAWILDFFEKNGPGCNAIVGISGGKDSSVTAALCAEALGKERVIGVLMPCGIQSDIEAARLLVRHLGIQSVEINIGNAVSALLAEAEKSVEIQPRTRVNLPPRIRMATLYAVGQSRNGRVANTCNLSEDWVGYSTRYGDSAGDFAPLARLTVTEVREIGRALGLPRELVEKVPSDGVSGKNDEDNLGFTYADLDRYIREGVCEDAAVRDRIDSLHEKNKFKLELMPYFDAAVYEEETR